MVLPKGSFLSIVSSYIMIRKCTRYVGVKTLHPSIFFMRFLFLHLLLLLDHSRIMMLLVSLIFFPLCIENIMKCIYFSLIIPKLHLLTLPNTFRLMLFLHILNSVLLYYACHIGMMHSIDCFPLPICTRLHSLHSWYPVHYSS